MRRVAVALICGLLPAVASAQVYRAINQLAVLPISPTDFEVIEAHGEGPRGMWCAAASYAEARGIHRDQRLYVKRARGPSVSLAGETGVVFTTVANEVAGTAHRSYSVSVREKGLNLPIHHASQFCIDYLIEPQDRL